MKKIEVEKSKLYCEHWFPTQIYYKDLPNSTELNKSLIKNILKWKKDDEKGIRRSNTTGWHSAVNMHQKKEYKDITLELFKMQQEIFEDNNYCETTMPWIDNMWANVNYKYSHNRNHVHPGAQWSGVYYIQCPEKCGNIWFTDPRGQAHIEIPRFNKKNNQKPQPRALREVYYQAIPGRLIMFPGWLTHEVEMNLSDLKGSKGWRMSISFNFKQINDPKKVQPAPIKGHAAIGKTLEDYE